MSSSPDNVRKECTRSRDRPGSLPPAHNQDRSAAAQNLSTLGGSSPRRRRNRHIHDHNLSSDTPVRVLSTGIIIRHLVSIFFPGGENMTARHVSTYANYTSRARYACGPEDVTIIILIIQGDFTIMIIDIISTIQTKQNTQDHSGHAMTA